MKAEQFLNDPEYKEKQIWDLKYISTSDEEDNDSSESSSASEEDEEKSDEEEKKVESPKKSKKEEEEDKEKYLDEEGKVDPKKIWKLSPGKNESVPQIA